MSVKRLLCVLAFPALLGLGCYAGTTAEVGVAYGEPPPPPAYYYTPAALDGYEWVDGSWYWGYDQWAWRPGYWIVARPGYGWVQGRWSGHAWHQGYWQAGARTGHYVAPSRAAGPGRVYAPPARSAPVRAGGHDHR